MEFIKVIALFADTALFGLMCVIIYRLQEKVNKLHDQLYEKNAIFRINGNVLEKQKKGRPNTTFNLTDGTIRVKPQIQGTRYNVGSKDEYTMYDGDPKKYYKNK